MHHVVQSRGWNRPVGKGLLQRVAEIIGLIEAERRFLVEAVNRRSRRWNAPAPIRQDKSLVAPILLQNLIEQEIVLAGIDLVTRL